MSWHEYANTSTLCKRSLYSIQEIPSRYKAAYYVTNNKEGLVVIGYTNSL